MTSSKVVIALSALSLLVPCQFAYATEPLPSLKADRARADEAPVNRAINASNSKMFKIHAGVSQEYVLGPGDVLSVTDQSEDKPTTTTVPILPDGTMVTSYTGVIRGAGKSLREVNEMVNSLAKNWYVDPQITVNLAKQRPTQIYLLGELVHPGLYSTGADSAPMTNSDSSGGDSGGGSGPSTSGSSTLTLSGALQMAGGLKETADVRHLRISRLAPKATIPVDLWKLMIDGDVSEDVILQPGDVVYVPKGGSDYDPSLFGKLVNNAPKVRVLGQVKTPGLLSMSPDDDLLSVIARAGGLEITAKSGFVMLSRTNRDGTITSEKVDITRKGVMDGHSMAHTKVRPGDLIEVRRSKTKTVALSITRNLPNLLTSTMMSLLIGRAR